MYTHVCNGLLAMNNIVKTTFTIYATAFFILELDLLKYASLPRLCYAPLVCRCLKIILSIVSICASFNESKTFSKCFVVAKHIVMAHSAIADCYNATVTPKWIVIEFEIAILHVFGGFSAHNCPISKLKFFAIF